MKNIDAPSKILKFGEYQRKGHNDKEMDPRQIKRVGNDRVIYLTFDMCPSDKLDTGIIDFLVSNKCEASFFVCVDWIEFNEGSTDLSFLNNSLFTIGGHGYRHVDPLKQSNYEQDQDINKALDYWTKAGKTIRWYRVPYGHPTETSFKWFSHYGIKCASWAGPVFDKKSDSVPYNPNDAAKFYIENSLTNGDIVLMHANGEGINTLNLLKEFTYNLSKQGYTFKKLPNV
jgi:peptidoglycan/xylan/chitin deacetylase (PgdA/CDA1 family)